MTTIASRKENPKLCVDCIHYSREHYHLTSPPEHLCNLFIDVVTGGPVRCHSARGTPVLCGYGCAFEGAKVEHKESAA